MGTYSRAFVPRVYWEKRLSDLPEEAGVLRMNLERAAETVREEGIVRITARGNSMTPIIEDGDDVIIESLKEYPLIGDVVLARVKGRYYLHKITAMHKDRFQISNNKGHINGYASEIVGIVTGIGV